MKKLLIISLIIASLSACAQTIPEYEHLGKIKMKYSVLGSSKYLTCEFLSDTVRFLTNQNWYKFDKNIKIPSNKSIYIGGVNKSLEWSSKQDVLVSGVTLKTINNTSLLGSENISIIGTSQWNNGSYDWIYYDNPVAINDTLSLGARVQHEGTFFSSLLSNSNNFTIYEDDRSDSIFVIKRYNGIRFDPNSLGYNVGIGVLKPVKTLDVNGSINGTSYYLNGIAKEFSQWTTSSSNIYFNTGNVGIGEASDAYYRLKINGKTRIQMPEDTETAFSIEGEDVYMKINTGTAGQSILFDHGGLGLKVGIGVLTPSSTLDVNGGVKIANDTDLASESKVGTIRYRVSGNNSYCEMVMQTGASTYTWVVIKTNSW